MTIIGCISAYILPLESEMEISEWIWEVLSEGTSKASEKWLVLGGSFDELNGNFFKEGMEVSSYDISSFESEIEI